MSVKRLAAGDQVFHPMYGFGVVEGMTTRDTTGQVGQKSDYYGVRLSDGGILSVPVARAEALGLRRVVNSLAAIMACLRSPAHPLPDDDRQRVIELKARWQSPQPAVIKEQVQVIILASNRHSLLTCHECEVAAQLQEEVLQFPQNGGF